MPSKRERGKQRKAVKNLAAGNGNDSITQIVTKVRKGDHNTTVLLGDCSPKHSLEESNGILYEQSGILSTVFKFLKRCEDDTFIKVMLDLGGDLKTPKSWVRVLLKAEVQEESCRLQIAENIGPLVRCMCNDTRRLFFKSNKHWVGTIQAFAALIHNMIFHSADNSDITEGKNKKIIDTLLQHEGLLTSIVQWGGFWNKEYRPDIAKEIETDICVDIAESGISTLYRLIRAADTQTEEGRKRLETISTTPMISKEYDPECTISLVVGLIRQIKVEGWATDASACLRRLITNVSCVDKDVITELIDIGFDTSDDKWVAHVAILLHYIILKRYDNEKWYPNDTRVAFAIRGGLIELCLTFIERFGVLESFYNDQDHNLHPAFVSTKMILSNIYWIELHKKTAKAIRSKTCVIEQELARLEQNTDITTNPKCKELLDIVRSILGLNGSYCCRCNKSLSRTEVKLCNGCGRMAYCSKACQREDWLNGHSNICCTSYTSELSGQYQGRILPEEIPSDEREASKLNEHETNLTLLQLKLFHDHSEIILSQASSLGIPLYDCFVRFDLTKCPLEVTTHKYTDFYDNVRLKRGFGDSRSKDNIACIFISDLYDGSLVKGRLPLLQLQRLFPHEWLPTWNL